MADLAWRAARGALFGLALFALAGNLLLLIGAAVSPWVLLACMTLGFAGGALGTGTAAAPIDRVPRWLALLCASAIALVALALAYGAMATPARDWDGIVAWGLKAAALTERATLAQPFFADPTVVHHSPDYPLLQPLCIALLTQMFGAVPARAFFPLLYLLLVAFVGLAVARRTGARALGVWCALGVATTPRLVGTGAGAVDSGYAEAFHACVLAAAAAALLAGDAPLACAAAIVLPFVKPEGTVHVLLLAGVTLAFAPARLRLLVVLGAAAALSIAVPLQMRLAHAPPAGPWFWVGVVSVSGASVGIRQAIARAHLSPRPAWLLGASIAAMVSVAIVLLAPRLAGSRSVLLSHYLGRIDAALDKLPQTGTILLGLLQTALSPRQFGLSFALLLLLALGVRRNRRPAGVGALVAFVVAALLAVIAAFYLSPEPSVRHHLRSSAPRLLLQMQGVVWILAGACLAALAGRAAPAPLPRWLAAALGRQPADAAGAANARVRAT